MLWQHKGWHLIGSQIIGSGKTNQLWRRVCFLLQNQVCVLTKVLQDGKPLCTLLFEIVPDQHAQLRVIRQRHSGR